MEDKWIIRGRELNQKDIAYIRKVVEEHFPKGRKYISREICHHWKWYHNFFCPSVKLIGKKLETFYQAKTKETRCLLPGNIKKAYTFCACK